MAAVGEALNLALEHHRAGRLAQAESLYRNVLRMHPAHPDALHLLGVLAHHNGAAEVAIELIGEAISSRGNVPVFHNNLGEAYRSLGRLAEAEQAYRDALRLDPQFAQSHNNLGTVLQNTARPADAIAAFDRAIACHGDYANAHYNRARTWLSVGDFAAGWREYEWRWRRAEFTRPAGLAPEWDGSTLAGRTLLVRGEQGLGDTLQFIRYVPRLQEMAERVIVEVQPPLVELLATSGFENVLPFGAELPPHDAEVMLLSVPLRVGTTLETVPAAVPYLRARRSLVEQWRMRLRSVRGFRIGVHWQGNPNSPLEPARSLPLASFEPLARIAGVSLVSLQKGAGREQMGAMARRFPVVDFGDELDGAAGAFMDTAALVEQLDLVVTSDSAVAHLAGAIGRNVLLVLPAAADWRWLRERADSPWYPTMRLFRQCRAGEWRGVMERVAATVTQMVANR